MHASQVWPTGYRSAAWFSFDIDGESWLLGADPRNSSLPVTMSQAAYGPKRGIHYVLEILGRYDCPATFFIPSWIATTYPAVIDLVLARDHEIGLHNHRHERPDLMSRDQEVEIVGRSIELLEQLTGERPLGYRAPMAEVSLNTTNILAEHRVQYSSHFMDDIFPYFHLPEERPAVLELPIHWTRDDWSYSMLSPYSLPTPHLNPIASNSTIIEVWQAELEAIHRLGGLFTLIAHPQVTGRPGRLQTLESLVAQATDKPDLWVTTGRDINDYWREAHPVKPHSP